MKKVEKESKKINNQLKNYLKKIVERDVILKNNVIEARGILKVNGYEFEYVIEGRKVKCLRLL